MERPHLPSFFPQDFYFNKVYIVCFPPTNAVTKAKMK